ncbi:MAG: FeoA family protein [Oscillospiraceae bacterium]|nr:FeoA family protein [Oscillospiraceae bacterium]
MEYRTLDTLLPGQSAVVREVRLDGPMARRLKELGLVVGTRVRCLQKSPSGDPTAYWIRGAAVALRREDAGNVLVERRWD